MAEKDEEFVFNTATYLFSKFSHRKARYMPAIGAVAFAVTLFIMLSSVAFGIFIHAEALKYDEETAGTHIVNPLADSAVVSVFSLWIVLTAVAIFITTGLVIGNTVQTSIAVQRKEIGILGAVGLSKKEVTRIFMYEGLFLGYIGFAIGLFSGLFLANQVLQTIPQLVPYGLPNSMPYPILGSFFYTLGISALFSYHPAKRAASLNPIEALKG